MARNLARNGALNKPLLLWNRTIALAKKLHEEESNTVVGSSLQQVAEQADIIWLCLLNDRAASEVYDQILQSPICGTRFVDCSTLSGEFNESMTESIRAKGAELIAMPVFGEPKMAATAALICVPTGEATAVESIQPFLEGVLCRATVNLSGLPPKQASTLKLIGNVLSLTTMEQIAEACVLGEKVGLGTIHVRKLIDTMFPRPPHAVYVERMVSGGYHCEQPAVTISLALEVADHILKLAEDSNASIGSYKVAVDHLRTARDHLGPYMDLSAIYGAVRHESGLTFRSGDKDSVSVLLENKSHQ